MNQTKIHISERFFSKAKRYFGSLESALNEALQNAYRATLPRIKGGEVCNISVRWLMELKALQIRDYGIGISDIGAALSIGLSNWGKGVEEEQDPAGMGLCGVMAFCEVLTFRSQFGRLDVHTKNFFESKEYRDNLLATIDAKDVLGGDGTEITMVGVAASDTDIYQALTSAARFHTAIRITFAENEKEPTIIKNFLELENWKLREAPYRGYKVYDYRHGGSYGVNYNRDQLLVVWHGQCIKVPLEYVKTKIRLPEIEEPVETSLKLPGFEAMAIVIDYGSAPVTPKLPDRNALIMDAKTTEFITGLFLPEFEERIEKVRAGLIKEAAGLKKAGSQERRDAIEELVPAIQNWRRSQADRLCTMLTGPLYAALYNHYIGLARVRTMVPYDISEGNNGRYTTDLVPFDDLPAVFDPRIVLWSDPSGVGRVIEIDNEEINRFIIKRHSHAEASKIDWSERGTKFEDDFEVLPGVCSEIDTVVGSWSPRYDAIKLKKATVVVHLSKTAKQLGWKDGERCSGSFVEVTDGPVNLSLLIYEEDSETDTDLGVYERSDLLESEDRVGPLSMAEFIAAAPKVEVPCLMVRRDTDPEPDQSIFVGPEKEIMSLINLAVDFEHGGDVKQDEMSSEEWTEFINDIWDDFRSSISGIPELDDAISELINKIRSRVKSDHRGRIVSLSLNVDKNTLTYRTAEGKPVKTKYR